MRCVHCGEWNHAYQVFFKGPGGIQIMRHVYSASAKTEDLEAEARRLLESNWDAERLCCTVWDLVLDRVRSVGEEETGGPSEYSRPA